MMACPNQALVKEVIIPTPVGSRLAIEKELKSFKMSYLVTRVESV